jgi:hypothetical protein
MQALRCSILCIPLLWGCGTMADHPTASPAGQNLHTTAQTYYGDLRGQIYPPGNASR